MTDTPDAAVVTDEMREAGALAAFEHASAPHERPWDDRLRECYLGQAEATLKAALAHQPPSAALVEARAKVTKLATEVYNLRVYENADLRVRIAALEASNKAMRDDAERFQWLMEHHYERWPSQQPTATLFDDDHYIDFGQTAHKDQDIRAVIDASRAASSPALDGEPR